MLSSRRHGRKSPSYPYSMFAHLLEQKLLVFADFTSLAAYGSDKFAWQSPRVCWDELKITKVTSGLIEGTGYDPTNPLTSSRFAVDAKTGRSLLPSPSGMPD